MNVENRAVISRFFATLFCVPIRCYKRLISPLLPPCCRFYPSCSSYALLALEKHGIAKGLLLSAKRIARCNPWCSGGYDPVP